MANADPPQDQYWIVSLADGQRVVHERSFLEHEMCNGTAKCWVMLIDPHVYCLAIQSPKDADPRPAECLFQSVGLGNRGQESARSKRAMSKDKT